MKKVLVCAALAAAAALPFTGAHAANIIGFANNATSCGGSTLCSTDGTQGYSGTMAFNISTINSWFQIDTDGLSHLPGQPVEPNGGAGNFLVINDTGHVLTSFSLTILNTVNALTPSAQCSGGVCSANFQIHGGAANFFNTLSLTGPGCVANCGTDSADFKTGSVTYNWSGGPGVGIGAVFDLNFASWNNTITPVGVDLRTVLPEPMTWSMMVLGFGAIGCSMRRQSKVSVTYA